MSVGKIYLYLEKKNSENWHFIKCNEDPRSTQLYAYFGRTITKVFWDIAYGNLIADFYKRGLPKDVSEECIEKIEEHIQHSKECNLPYAIGWATLDEFINLDYDGLAGSFDSRYVPKEFAKFFKVGAEEFYNDDDGNITDYEPWPLEVPDEYRYNNERGNDLNFVEVFFQPAFKDILGSYFINLFTKAQEKCGEHEGRIVIFLGI